MKRKYCEKCVNYECVVLNYLEKEYKHKCKIGKFYVQNENIDINTEGSYQVDGLIFYSDNNLKIFWKNRPFCMMKNSFFLDKMLPNITALCAIIISIFSLLGTFKDQGISKKTSLSNNECVMRNCDFNIDKITFLKSLKVNNSFIDK